MARRSIDIILDRTDEILCDVAIFAGTGEDNEADGGDTEAASPILATKVFLYGISDKWKELIQSARKTLTKDADSVRGKIFIPQIRREIMENIIDFIYAALRNEIQPLPLDDQNVGNYFEAGKFLDMEDIESQCLNYFDSKIITLQNVSVLFNWSETFGMEAIQPKMRTFLTQHSQQIPEIIRRCKNELNIPEAQVALILIDWLSFCSTEGESCDLDVKQLVRQFSSKNERIKLIDALFEGRNLDWRKAAIRLLRNLYKNGHLDSDSEDIKNEAGDNNFSSDSTSAQQQVQNPSATKDQSPLPSKRASRSSTKLATKKSRLSPTARKPASMTGPVQRPPKSKSSCSRAPSKRISSKSGPTSNPMHLRLRRRFQNPVADAKIGPADKNNKRWKGI